MCVVSMFGHVQEASQIRDFFEWREAGDTPAGLTLAGWLDMYHTQTGSDQVTLL